MSWDIWTTTWLDIIDLINCNDFWMTLTMLVTLLVRDVIVCLPIETWERRRGRSYHIIIDERHYKTSKQSKDADFKRYVFSPFLIIIYDVINSCN
jgi:hypothetical protein